MREIMRQHLLLGELMTREQELEQRYQDFQEWLNQCPLVVTDYQDFTDLFQITFSLNAD